MVAKRIDLGLSLRQITEPRYFHHVTLHDGTLNIQPQATALLLQADVLQLSNMALQSSDEHWQLNAQKVNAGIMPWQPKANHLFGENNQFQFSAGSVTLNGIPASQVLIQSELKHNQLLLNNVGADLAQGNLTGAASRGANGSWQVERLRLSGVRMQTPLTLEQLTQPLQYVANIHPQTR